MREENDYLEAALEERAECRLKSGRKRDSVNDNQLNNRLEVPA